MCTVITSKKLTDLGFNEIKQIIYEDDFSYSCVYFIKGRSKLEITTEYCVEGNPVKQRIAFNGKDLMKINITLPQLKNLISLM